METSNLTSNLNSATEKIPLAQCENISHTFNTSYCSCSIQRDVLLGVIPADQVCVDAINANPATSANTAMPANQCLPYPNYLNGAADMLLKINEVAEAYLNVSRATVYRLVATGKLKLVHIRGCSRISLESVVAYMERLRKEAF